MRGKRFNTSPLIAKSHFKRFVHNLIKKKKNAFILFACAVSIQKSVLFAFFFRERLGKNASEITEAPKGR